jgi:hypothetical protein
MKPVLNLFLVAVLISFVVASCTKDNVTDEEQLSGKWRLVETFNGYANGGDFTWNPVSIDYLELVEFKENGQYAKFVSFSGSVQNCIGSYNYSPGQSLQINSSCNQSAQILQVTELANATLILNSQVREGYIGYKYARQ